MDTPNRLRILVVEDDDAVRGWLRRLLTLEGYDVVEAATVEAGLQKVQSANIGLVILDLLLPEHHSGLELLHHLRTHRAMSDIPVIILTGKSLTEDEETQIRSEVAYVFYKPCDPKELVTYIDRLRGQHVTS